MYIPNAAQTIILAGMVLTGHRKRQSFPSTTLLCL